MNPNKTARDEMGDEDDEDGVSDIIVIDTSLVDGNNHPGHNDHWRRRHHGRHGRHHGHRGHHEKPCCKRHGRRSGRCKEWGFWRDGGRCL